MATANVHKLVLIKPVNEAMPEQSGYAPRPAGLQGKRVGLLDNSKNNAGRFLEMVGGDGRNEMDPPPVRTGCNEPA